PAIPGVRPVRRLNDRGATQARHPWYGPPPKVGVTRGPEMRFNGGSSVESRGRKRDETRGDRPRRGRDGHGDARGGIGNGWSGLTPPDMGVGADATHVVQMVNVVGKIWTSGVAGSAFQLDAFFLSTGQFVSDPWVMYDQESGRWFAGIFNVTIGGEAIAISTT